MSYCFVSAGGRRHLQPSPLAGADLGRLRIGAGAVRRPAPAGAAGGGPCRSRSSTLAEKPVEQSSEFVGTVRSRRSVTIQSQVEGFITRST